MPARRREHSPAVFLLRNSPRCMFAAAMFHDLNVPWTKDERELKRTVAFLDEREYHGPVALASPSSAQEQPSLHRLTSNSRIRCGGPRPHICWTAPSGPGASIRTFSPFVFSALLPRPSGSSVDYYSRTRCAAKPRDWRADSMQTSPVQLPLPFAVPARLRVLRRCNIFLTDAASNFRIPQLQQHYDLIAARPTDEKTLQQACASLDVDIISLDLTQKFEKHFKYPMLGTAIARGVKIEVCYGQAILSSDPAAKRNLISNATQLIRVSRGRGLIFSSEARNALGIRAPSDVMNLACIWGLGSERAKDALTKEARSIVEYARLKRQSYKGVVDVVYGGEKPSPEDGKGSQKAKDATNQLQEQKRKAHDSLEGTPVSRSGGEKAVSKRQMKKNKKARLEVEQ